MRYLILTSGKYSSYSVDFIEFPEEVNLTQEELLFMLNIDSHCDYEVAGEIRGELKGWEPMVIKETVRYEIDSIFCCYDNRPTKTVLDRKRTQEELLKIAIDNDNSGIDYWKREIANSYKKYDKAFDLFQRLK